jgi:hypothetical protein
MLALFSALAFISLLHAPKIFIQLQYLKAIEKV